MVPSLRTSKYAFFSSSFWLNSSRQVASSILRGFFFAILASSWYGFSVSLDITRTELEKLFTVVPEISYVFSIALI